MTDFAKQLRYDANFFSHESNRSWRARVRGADSAFDMQSVSPAKQAARLTRPILLAHGKEDSNVPFSEFKEMRDALSSANFTKVDYLVFDKE